MGWICATPTELAAAILVLDESHAALHRIQENGNTYTYGLISNHNVVIACLPAGEKGSISASFVATHLKLSFPNVKYGLLVGTCGGIPSAGDIRKGDVCVGIAKSEDDPAVFQYDFGEHTPSGFQPIMRNLKGPGDVIPVAVANVKANHDSGTKQFIHYMQQGQLRASQDGSWQRPPPQRDLLFKSTFHHVGRNFCEDCDPTQLVQRAERPSQEPVVHYGKIGSGNTLHMDPVRRDELASLYSIMCLEMEASGVVNVLPTLVIKGVSNYADSHKNSEWTRYAALAAAGYAKEFISHLPAVGQ